MSMSEAFLRTVT